MREPNPSTLHLATNDIEALLAHNRSLFGNAVMTADPSAATPPVTIDPRTGDPAVATPATDPAGVWSGDVTPPPGITTVPAPTQTPPVAPVPVANQPYVEIEGRRYYTEDYLETARSQERDKMHQRLESIEQRLQREQQEREEREKAIREQAAAEAAEAERQRLQSLPLEERLQEMQQSWEQRWAERDQQDAARDALAAQEQRFNDLMSYRARRIAEESDLIHPTLIDLVASPETGAATEQQIEESIAGLKAKTDAIVGTVRQAEVEQRRVMPGVAPTGQPHTPAPLDQASGYQSITAADIAQMDPATYAKNRTLLMEAMRQKVQTTGLYSP